MDRLIAPYTVALALADVAPATGTPAYATDGNPATNTPATQWPAYQYNALQEELMAIIAAGSITPDRTKNNQAVAAIKAFLQSGAVTAAPDTGTVNALAASLTPAPASLSAGMSVTVLNVVATNTGAVTLNLNGLGVVPIVGVDGSALSGGEIQAGKTCVLTYSAMLSKWILLNALASNTVPGLIRSSAVASVQGVFRNLKASATGTNASVAVSVDEIALENSANAYQVVRAVSLTINSAASGTNGLDTGTLAASTWYSVWVISNGTTTAGLLSLSATAPTLPVGYTYMARVGWIRTDATANKYPLAFKQYGRRVQYVVGSGTNVPGMPQMASGVAGNISTPTWVAVGVSSFVPPTASRIVGQLSCSTATGISYMIAPNANYGSYASTTNPPWMFGTTSGGSAATSQMPFEMALESTNIYWANNGTAYLACSGWEDNL